MIRCRLFRIHRFRAALAAAFLAAASGCGGGSADELDRQNVWGKVTLDGAPLPSGIISFDPAGGSAGAVPAGGIILGGSYNIERANGPTPGTYRVSIRSTEPDDGTVSDEAPGASNEMRKGPPFKDPIPPEYNSKSTLTAEIGARTTEANFDLKSK